MKAGRCSRSEMETAGAAADGSSGPRSLVERFQALLAVAESITSCRDPEELFRGLARHLQRVVRFDRLGLVLLHPERGVASARVFETTGAGFTTLPECPIDGSHSGWVIETQQPLVVADTAAETRWPDAMADLRERGIISFCSLPLTTGRRRVGALGFGSRVPVAYTSLDVTFLGEVAKLVAVAVDNALNFDEAQATQRQLSTERDHLRLLLDVTNAMVSKPDLPELLDAISAPLERVIPHESATLALYDKDRGELVVHAVTAKSSDARRYVGKRFAGSAAGEAFAPRRTLLLREADLTGRFADTAAAMRETRIRSVCAVPLVVGERGLGTLTVGSRQPDAFPPASVAMIEEVARQVAMAVANALAFREIAQLTEKLAEERLYLENEIRAEHPFEEIVGESRPLRDVLQQVETVAPTDATVLILGETGTGQELMARAIHDRSGRRERPFVKIHCAAIPPARLPQPRPAVAGATRGHPRAGPFLRATPRPPDEPARRGDPQRDPRGTPPVCVAGERAGARQPPRAGDDPLEGANARSSARRARAPSASGRSRGRSLDPRGCRADAHPARPRRDELDARWPAGRRSPARNETHDAAVVDEEARDHQAPGRVEHARRHRLRQSPPGGIR